MAATASSAVDERVALPDPHNISSNLDPDSSARIIIRLESRGADAVFRSLFESYFPRLLSCRKVLEVGCGTGVLMRALIKNPEFTGHVAGLDQSLAFLETARHLAQAEGCDMSRIRFVEGDAHAAHDVSTILGGKFDAVIMHTLLSHVSDPLEVLQEAHELAAPGALLVVMDGDYSSLSYADADNPERGQRMDKALVAATFTKPNVVRELPRLLPSAGWTITEVTSKCVSEVGTEASYWLSFAKAYMPRVKQAKLVPEQEVDAWWRAQEAFLQQGCFFAVGNYFTYFATKSGESSHTASGIKSNAVQAQSRMSAKQATLRCSLCRNLVDELTEGYTICKVCPPPPGMHRCVQCTKIFPQLTPGHNVCLDCPPPPGKHRCRFCKDIVEHHWEGLCMSCDA